MKKEVFLAITIGFILGLIITFGVWTANKALKQAETQTKMDIEEVQVTPPATITTGFLIITTPEDNALINQEKIELAGKTTPGAIVAVIYSESEKILEADNEGLFSTQITLEGGPNQITVSAFDEDGNETSKTLNLVYSTAEI